MFFCHPQDGLYVVICQAIAYQLSLAAVFHQLGLLQQPELVGLDADWTVLAAAGGSCAGYLLFWGPEACLEPMAGIVAGRVRR